MNILSAEEMKAIEASLLQLQIPNKYQLNFMVKDQVQNLHNFSSSLLTKPTPAILKEIQNVIALTNRVQCISLDDDNAVFVVLLHVFFFIIYKNANHSEKNYESTYLLETIKCSLYSPDLSLLDIKNTNIDKSMPFRAIIAQFFSKIFSFESFKQAIERNKVILTIFNIFFRCILTKLDISNSNNYNKKVKPSEAIPNLLEYFDLNCRIFNNLYLFNEDGIFIYVGSNELVFGEYFENESQKMQSNEALQIKNSINLNMIESFLVQVQPKKEIMIPNLEGLNSKDGERRQVGIVESDVKLFNFILDSDRSDDQHCKVVVEKETESETPHFGENTSEQFHFGKKRKNTMQKTQEIRSQFERLINDQSEENNESEYDEEANDAPTPFLGTKQSYHFGGNQQKQLKQPKNPILQSITEMDFLKENHLQIYDSPIGSLEEEKFNFIAQPKGGLNQVHLPKDKPQEFKRYSLDPGPKEQFKKVTVNQFIKEKGIKKEFKFQSKKNQQCLTCAKRQNRKMKLIPQTFQATYIPMLNQNRKISESNVKENIKYQNICKNQNEPERLKCKSPIRFNNEPQKEEKKRQFFKCLNKEKNGKVDQKTFNRKEKQDFKRYSSIFQTNDTSSKQNCQGYAAKSAQKPHSFQETEKQIDYKNLVEPPTPRLQVKMHKSSVSCYTGELQNEKQQKNSNPSNINLAYLTNQVSEVNHISSKLNNNEGMAIKQNNDKLSSAVKFYAPVQIIAPTFVMKSNDFHNNKIIFRVDEPQYLNRYPQNHFNSQNPQQKPISYQRLDQPYQLSPEYSASAHYMQAAHQTMQYSQLSGQAPKLIQQRSLKHINPVNHYQQQKHTQ